MFLVGRAIQGAGGSGILLMVEIIIADLAPVKKRPQYIGMMMGISGIGSIVAPTIGGAIADRTTWRWVIKFPNLRAKISRLFKKKC
jgi:MFS family permease